MSSVPPTNPTTLDPFAGREIWFLTGSQHLYGPEVLEEVKANSRDIVAHLDGADELFVARRFHSSVGDFRDVGTFASMDAAVAVLLHST